MADVLVERVTGRATTEAVGVGLHLVMPADTLLPTASTDPDRLHEPGFVPGYGFVPAQWARDLVRNSLERLGADGAGWLRRLVTEPTTGAVVGLDSSARCFPEGLGRLIGARDAGICRTPWCDAPIRHLDHVAAHVDGGVTSLDNGQGLCEACNHSKEAPGWSGEPVPDSSGRHSVVTTTPTGHTYRSTAPPLPGGTSPPRTPPGTEAPPGIGLHLVYPAFELAWDPAA